LQQARSIYKEILKLEPRHFEALQLSGAIELQTGQWDRALELLIKAIKINDRNAAVFYNYGKSLKELGQAREALIGYEKSIKLKPDYSEAYFNRGIILTELNRLE